MVYSFEFSARWIDHDGDLSHTFWSCHWRREYCTANFQTFQENDTKRHKTTPSVSQQMFCFPEQYTGSYAKKAPAGNTQKSTWLFKAQWIEESAHPRLNPLIAIRALLIALANLQRYYDDSELLLVLRTSLAIQQYFEKRRLKYSNILVLYCWTYRCSCHMRKI